MTTCSMAANVEQAVPRVTVDAHSLVLRIPAGAWPRVLLRRRRRQSSINLAGKALWKAWRVAPLDWMHSIDAAAIPDVSRPGLSEISKLILRTEHAPVANSMSQCSIKPSYRHSQAGRGLHRMYPVALIRGLTLPIPPKPSAAYLTSKNRGFRVAPRCAESVFANRDGSSFATSIFS
jgi:hypothetical protein